MEIDIKNVNIFKGETREHGILIPIEFSDIEFIPKRIFLVTDCEPDLKRGCHAHRSCVQILMCIRGEVSVYLNDGTFEKSFCLTQGDSIFVDKKIWNYYTMSSKSDVLLVICSEPYDRDEYIFELEELKTII